MPVCTIWTPHSSRAIEPARSMKVRVVSNGTRAPNAKRPNRQSRTIVEDWNPVVPRRASKGDVALRQGYPESLGTGEDDAVDTQGDCGRDVFRAVVDEDRVRRPATFRLQHAPERGRVGLGQA